MKKWSTVTLVLLVSVALFLVIVPLIWLAGMLIGGGVQIEWAIFPVMMLLAIVSFGGIALAGARLCLRIGLSVFPAVAMGAVGPLAGLVLGGAYWGSVDALVEWWPVSLSAAFASILGALLAARRRRLSSTVRPG